MQRTRAIDRVPGVCPAAGPPAASHRRWPAAASALLLLAAWSSAAGPPETDRGDLERVHWDEPGPDGHLRGGVVWTPRPASAATLSGDPPAVTTIHGGGDPDFRLDVVFVGDGYTADELDLWAARCDALATALLAGPPFNRYAPLIAIHRVDVISAESGVDHDPEFGVLRNTTLDMGFWCAGIERLLCVNTAKAQVYAGVAPGRDLVIAVANSSSYGGAGYDGIATTSAAHPDSPEIMIHEIGHSLAGLGDEYFSDGVYDGPEPAPRNISRLDAAAMAAAGTKWAAWLGAPAPAADGPVGGFEGAFLFAEGLHRPTGDSRMRSLYRPFNPPSLEALVLSIHSPIGTIELALPPTSATLNGNETLTVQPVPVGGEPLTIIWTVDGSEVPGGPDGTLVLADHGPPLGSFLVTAIATDATDLIRDESARAALMQQSRTWTVERITCLGDLDADAAVGTPDLLILLSNWGCTACVGDIDADGSVGILDLILLLQAWGSC